MLNPPSLVRLAMEAVVCLVRNYSGNNELGWEIVRRELKDTGLISSVLAFTPDQIQPATGAKLQKDYLSNSAWDTDRIDHASKAAGPLALWVESQIKYVSILQSVEPLKNEISKLETEQDSNRQKLKQNKILLVHLEGQVEKYKKEYTETISQASLIKNEISRVKALCEKCSAIVQSLSEERIRWFGELSKMNDANMPSDLVADSIIACAFAAFAGGESKSNRISLLKTCRESSLIGYHVSISDSSSVVNFLSTPLQRYRWKRNELPDDEINIENGVILSRLERYPLIIDPEAETCSVRFLLKEHERTRIRMCSASDKLSFTKVLESCLRFGTPLIVKDIWALDVSQVRSVIARETTVVNGRVLVTVGLLLLKIFNIYLL
jgi:dynein heavy chain 1, cytosolic